MTPGDVYARDAQGRWAAGGVGPGGAPAGASIDSRTIRPGEAFFALRGARTDGHRHVADALAAGAWAAVLDDPRALDAPGVIAARALVVDDARRALGLLAAAHRQRLRARVVAVTGSMGKTTTVRLTFAAVSRALRAACSPGSHNNDIGLPLTLLNASLAADVVVCELGSNHPGEIAALGAIARPDVAVITCVGSAHLEGFGSREGVVCEKTSLLDHLAPGGGAVLPADDPRLADARARARRLVTFGLDPCADVRVSDVRAGPWGVRCRIGEVGPVRLGLLGAHNALNAAAAAAAASLLGVPPDAVRRGLESIRAGPMRLERVRAGGIEVINDAYNASLEAMFAGVRALVDAAPDARRRVAVLGDMLELGSMAQEVYAELAEGLSKIEGVDLLVLVGPGMARAADLLRDMPVRARVVHVPAADDPAPILALLHPGDCVLLKASRGMRLERVAGALQAAAGASAV